MAGSQPVIQVCECVCVRVFLEQTVHYVTSDSNASRAEALKFPILSSNNDNCA